MSIFGMGPLELGLVAAIALIVFGPEKLPELARQVGKLVGEVRRFSADATNEFQRNLALDDPGVARPRRTILPPTEADPAPNRESPLPPY
jgi:Tat protein translocase TatB subunit